MSPPGRTLQVYPDAGRRLAALRAAGQGRGLALGRDLLTWDDFVGVLGGARELNRRPCSALVARTVVASLAQELGPTPFGDFVNEPAFARAALELLLDFKAGRLSPRELQDAAEVLPPERRPRVRVLARLYDRYEQRMALLGLADLEDVLRGAREALGRGAWPEPWDDVTQVLLHGVYDVRASGLELLLALASACEGRRVGLRVETPVGGSPVADAALAALFRAFENRGDSLVHVDLFKADVTFEARPLMDVGRHLFSERAPVGEVDTAGALRMWSAPTAQDEARRVAREVRRLVTEGVAPSCIAVAWREPGPELGWLADALGELGVPVRLPWGEPLALAGPVRLALELPLLAEDGFPAERVAEWVASRYAPTLSRGAPEAPATLLTQAAVRDDRLGASRGRGAYEIRLEALARRFTALEPKKNGLVHAVRVLRERCQRLMAVCRKLPEQASALELLRAWWAAVRELGLTDSEGALEARVEDSLTERSLEARARDDAAREALSRRVLELGRLLGAVGGGPRLSRRTFGRWLADAMKDAYLPSRGPASGAVEVLDVREVPGRSFEHLFLAGLTEGRFPGREPPNPLLGDSERVALNKHLGRDVFRLTGGEFEERAPWRLTEDRLLFASALVAAEACVHLSFAVAAPGGQEQLPSAFLEEVRRLTGQAWEARSLPAIVPLDEVLTEAELRQRVALETLALAKLRVSEPDAAGPLLRQRLGQEAWFGEARELAHVEAERLYFFSGLRAQPGPYSGAVEGMGEALREAFAFDILRPLSASALARFGNCTYQGFLSYGLKVAEPEQPGEELDPRRRGTFWHRVLEELFERLKAAGLLGKGVDEVPPEVLEAALKVAAEHLEKREYVGHHALWRLAREKALSMARRILADERRGLPFEHYVPEGFELPFGPQAEGPWRNVFLMADEEPIFFEGKIDRLDAAAGDVGVIDYKSGKLDKRALKDRLLTSDFQLPLYLYAARSSGYLQASQAAWFSLRTGTTIHLTEVLDEPGEVEDMLATDTKTRERLAQEGRLNLANAVEGLVRTLRAGQFAARPKDCGSCGYRAVCRITERRVMLEEGA